MAYELPNATVGYHLGYGVVADFQPLGVANRTDQLRVIVIAAVKNDLALIAAADGPFREFTPSSARAALAGQPADRSGHGQIRQQLQLAGRPAR